MTRITANICLELHHCLRAPVFLSTNPPTSHLLHQLNVVSRHTALHSIVLFSKASCRHFQNMIHDPAFTLIAYSCHRCDAVYHQQPRTIVSWRPKSKAQTWPSHDHRPANGATSGFLLYSHKHALFDAARRGEWHVDVRRVADLCRCRWSIYRRAGVFGVLQH